MRYFTKEQYILVYSLACIKCRTTHSEDCKVSS